MANFYIRGRYDIAETLLHAVINEIRRIKDLRDMVVFERDMIGLGSSLEGVIIDYDMRIDNLFESASVLLNAVVGDYLHIEHDIVDIWRVFHECKEEDGK